jgi:nucleoside-diphosphate-sugar epimerase
LGAITLLETLVTGSTGFVGSHLVKALLERGMKVRCLLREGKSNEQYLKDLDVEKFYIHNYSEEDLIKSGALNNLDYLFHNAGVTKGLTLKDFMKGNTAPTIELLKAVKHEKSGIKRFIYVSSSAVAGPASSLNEPISNNNFSRPIEHYGKSKMLGEFAVKSSGIPFTIVRPGGVYGPRDVDYFKLFKLIHKGTNPFFGNRNKYQSMIHVHDLVTATIEAAFNNQTEDETYFLCNDNPASWEELQSMIVDAVGEKARIKEKNYPSFFMNIGIFFGELYTRITKKPSLLNRQKLKLSQPDYWVFSNKKAKDDFGFETKIPLEEGIKETYRWYCKNKWLRNKNLKNS